MVGKCPAGDCAHIYLVVSSNAARSQQSQPQETFTRVVSIGAESHPDWP
jgi:hypothetical protein